MRKLIYLVAILLYSFNIVAQEDCQDVVYPADSDSTIFNCCIYKVTGGNLVHFISEGDSLIVLASAIKKGGLKLKLNKEEPGTINTPTYINYSDSLYKGHTYVYYQQTYKNASWQRNGGIGMTVVGIICEAAGFISASRAETIKEQNAAENLIIFGIVFESVGIPLWISGGIKRANNRKAMDEIEAGANLSVEVTGNGFGLILRF